MLEQTDVSNPDVNNIKSSLKIGITAGSEGDIIYIAKQNKHRFRIKENFDVMIMFEKKSFAF